MIAMDFWQCHPVLAEDKNYTLDLAFTNILGTKFKKPSEFLSIVDLHHPPATFTVPFSGGPVAQATYSYRNYRRANYDAINEELSRINWMKEFDGLNCDRKLHFLYETLNRLIDTYVSLKCRKPLD